MNKNGLKNFTAAEERAYEIITRAFENFDTEVEINKDCDIDLVLKGAVQCSVEYFWVDVHYQILKLPSSLKLRFNYIYDKNTADALRTKIEKVARDAVDELTNAHQSEYDKALVLHDWLKKYAVYDYDAARALSEGASDPDTFAAHTTVGALLNRKCVCEGFAKAYSLLCNMAGLWSSVIAGELLYQGQRAHHAWNIVRMGGHYHHIDLTLDNQKSDENNVFYAYFGLDDDSIAGDHTWERTHFPSCPLAPYNYYKFNECLLDSKSQLKSWLKNKIAFEEELLGFKLVKGSLLDSPDFVDTVSQTVTEVLRSCRKQAELSFGAYADYGIYYLKIKYL